MRGALPLILLAFAGAAAADEAPAQVLPRDLQVHGFVSQGFVLSKGNNVNGTSKDSSGSFKYQEAGVNGSWRPRGDLLLAGQVAAVRAGDAIDEYLTLEYGVVDYTPFQGEHGRLGIRAGKIKLPIGFYNDSRDAVFTRPGILMPQGVYLDNSGARAFGYFSATGGSLYGDWYLGDHALYLEAGGLTRQELGDTADIAILRAHASGRFKLAHGVQLRLADDWDGGRFRAALSGESVRVEYQATGAPFSATNPFAQNGGLDFRQMVASLQYNWDRFSLTGEYVWRTFDLSELVPPNPFGASTVTSISPSGAYLQGTWRATPRWSAFLRYDEEIRDANDRNGYAQSARFHQPRWYYFAKDWTAGTRYDLLNNLSVMGEFHYVDGDAWVNPLDNPGFNSGTAPRYWNMFVGMLAFRF